jgi:hypothetical protein
METRPRTTRLRAHERTVQEFAERVPTLRYDRSLSAIVAACLAHDTYDWLVLVDERDRPVRLVERAAMLLGTPFEHPVDGIAADCPIAIAARRIGTRPLVVQDRHGSYAGIVRVEALLAALAG